MDTRDITMVFKGESHSIKQITAYYCDACGDSIYGHSTDPNDKFGKELLRIHDQVRINQLCTIEITKISDIEYLLDQDIYLPDYRSHQDPISKATVRPMCEKVRDPDYDLDPENLSEFRPDGKIVYKVLESEFKVYQEIRKQKGKTITTISS